MSADIYNISDWEIVDSSWEDLSVKVLQRETAVKAVLSLLWINSMTPDKMVEYLATQRKITDALENSNNKIMQHIPEQDWVKQEKQPKLTPIHNINQGEPEKSKNIAA